jgi:flagellar biosynthesis chaperone FliJ
MPRRPKYGLEPYLEKLRAEKEEALKALSAAEEELRTEREKLDGLRRAQAELEQTASSRRETYWTELRKGELSGGEIAAHRGHLEALDSDIKDGRLGVLGQERAVRRAEKRVEETREDLARVANEVTVHEEKKERWLAELRREEERKEQKQMEEISATMYERRRREERRKP